MAVFDMTTLLRVTKYYYNW